MSNQTLQTKNKETKKKTVHAGGLVVNQTVTQTFSDIKILWLWGKCWFDLYFNLNL